MIFKVSSNQLILWSYDSLPKYTAINKNLYMKYLQASQDSSSFSNAHCFISIPLYLFLIPKWKLGYEAEGLEFS